MTLFLKNAIISYTLACRSYSVFNNCLHLSTKKMGSSNCKSFSPSKLAAAANIKENSQKASSEETMEEFVEDIVCNENDLKENEMKTFDLGDHGKVLVVKQNGKITALGSKCTHYNAPLGNGVLNNGRIRCQWHGACFNVATGDIEDYPGLDSLPCFKVNIVDGKVKVQAKKAELKTSKRLKSMVKRDESNKNTFVCIGGGPSSATCVEVLRQEGFTGRIVMICKENHFPYDRIQATKQMDVDVDTKFLLRNEKFYLDNSIEVKLNKSAVSLDPSEKKINLCDGEKISYDKCFIATGCKANIPDIPGVNLKNVTILRTFDDANFIFQNINKTSHVVILGDSFIGMESAAYLTGKVEKVTVVGRGDVPLAAFGKEIGGRIKELFLEKGVKIVSNSGITKFLSSSNDSSQVGSVELLDGSTLKADLCILGVGSKYYTDFLKDIPELNLNKNGTVSVNEFMQTGLPDVFCGGDIAHAQIYSAYKVENGSIGHFGLAHYHGRIAALNMLNKSVPLKAVPYFWTVLFGKSIRYTGYGKYDEVLIDGNLDEMKFLAFFLKKIPEENDSVVVAMAGCQRDPYVSKFAEFLSEGKVLKKSDIKDDVLSWAN